MNMRVNNRSGLAVPPDYLNFGSNNTSFMDIPKVDYSVGNPMGTSNLGLGSSNFGSNVGQTNSPTNWFGDLMNWGKSNMGTAKEPGLIPMGFGGLMGLMNFGLGKQQLDLQKAAYRTNRDQQLAAIARGTKTYNDTIASNAQADASNLFGARVGSDANTAYVNQMKKERSIA
jgi:hypothetical protein